MREDARPMATGPDHFTLMRIAMRQEGAWWVAYAAKLDTMDGAVELLRIRFKLIEFDRMLKERFMELVKAAFDTACRESMGVTPEYRTGWEVSKG